MAPHSVDSYLTLLSEDELNLEIKSGNSEALYVMGANKHWSSFRTGYKNPALNLNNNVAPDKDKNLDKETLDEARYYLWEAALNGMPMALIELSSTYSTEIKRSRLTNEDEALSNQYLYRKLFDSVAPSISELFYGKKPELEEVYSRLDFKSLEARFSDIQKRWSEGRVILGKTYKFDLEIPDFVSEAYNGNYNVCD